MEFSVTGYKRNWINEKQEHWLVAANILIVILLSINLFFVVFTSVRYLRKLEVRKKKQIMLLYILVFLNMLFQISKAIGIAINPKHGYFEHRSRILDMIHIPQSISRAALTLLIFVTMHQLLFSFEQAHGQISASRARYKNFMVHIFAALYLLIFVGLYLTVELSR